MAVIHRKQLSAMGIHYLYYPLDYMLDAQAKAGFHGASFSDGPYRISGDSAGAENGRGPGTYDWLFYPGVCGVSVFDVCAG